MKKAVASELRLVPHPCPLCGSSESGESHELYPAQISASAFSKTIFSARRSPDKLHYRIVKCRHDDMVRSDPILPVKNLDQLYLQSLFTYEQEVANLVKTYMTALEPTLSLLQPSASILEIGCGNGFMLEALIKRGFHSVVGVEPSTEAVAKAHTKIRKQITQAPFSASLFKPASLDAIVLFQTLDHIPNLNQFMADCYTLLKPGGYFMSYHHNVDHWLVRTLGESHPIIDVEHTQLFDTKSTKAIVARHGLLVRHLRYPENQVSLRHLIFLLPIPKGIKSWLIQSSFSAISSILKTPLHVSLGNIWVVAQKPIALSASPALKSKVLSTTQKELRRQIVKWSFQEKLSHIGSCLSCVDLIQAIYELKEKSDEFILSSGHAAFAWYAVLVKQGLLSSKVALKLSVHPDRELKNNIGVSTGSLGQGLPIAVGKALANRKHHVYCLTSDGEWSEGSMSEALRVAANEKLSNLTVIVNFNGWGAFRQTYAPQIVSELSSFDVDVLEVDGHSPTELLAALTPDPEATRPKIVIAHTSAEQIPCLKGQAAHYHVMNEEEYQEALQCLK